MKVNVEIDMTPEEARKVMGLPDVSTLQEAFVAKMQKRMMAALDGCDPQALLKAWMPQGGFDQFQKFLWEGAKRAADPKKDRSER
ncbi:MAG: hypothetical protein KGM97_01670 [Alphaproteobacteria bacterium]|nr:hypothetical protein [Alphaproteobacteria bacterium]MDE2629673.1 hypothetical protein [Alphaproteobacteria bacterium]